MAHASDPQFVTFHALRVRGMAPAATLAEMAGYEEEATARHLDELAAQSMATFVERRALWQITSEGRADHPRRLAGDLTGVELGAIAAPYEQFKVLNTEFKELCGRWQLRDGALNDHADAAYDAVVIKELVALDGAAQPIVVTLGSVLVRLQPYAARLRDRSARVAAGETNMFAGVLCGSFHDVWMELHEDLLLTQGISRAAEGSY